jgi:preprotein translocase subunit SecY
MWQTLKNAWKIPDLRKRIFYTVMMLAVFRVGSIVPVPFLDASVLKQLIEASSSTIFGYFNILTGGAFAQATIFALSITPYINASIILNLLTIAIPSLERLAKEGEEGRKKIAQYTRYLTVVLGLIQGFGYYATLRAYNAVNPNTVFSAVVIVATFTAGTAFIMWLGEQITEKGIGNGISIILFAGIISRGPDIVQTAAAYMQNGTLNIFTLLLIIAAAVAIVGFVVFMSNAERRIPVQYAKRVVGRKMYGGQSTHIPLKVNMTGVLPIIFAGSICTFPATVAMFFPQPAVDTFWYHFQRAVQPNTIGYAIFYFILIIFFNYFYVAVQFNPIEMANNMKKNGGFVPGIRPGKNTSDFISRILSKITFIGAAFLGIIATLPIVISQGFGLNFYLGGTSLLIVVGVALETVKQMESQMLMRHYKGFLE